MKDITLEDLKAVHPQYTGLQEGVRPEISSGQCIHREYKFEEAAKFPIYKISAKKDEEIVQFFNKFIVAKTKDVTEKDMLSFVGIALNLRHPITGQEIFHEPWTPDIMCSDFAAAVPSETRKVSMMTQSGSPAVVTTIVPSTERMEESMKDQANAICFLLSWLTRYVVKSPSVALSLQYSKLPGTYMKFYQKSSKIFSKFAPDSAWILSLRSAFDAFVRVKNTLVLHVASAETSLTLKQDPRAFNLLRFLYFQNLEFMGMHAYASIVSIINEVSLPPPLILTWLRMSGAELAIDEAGLIMSTLDNGMIPSGVSKERLWKYARLLDAGYFNRLQTSYVAELMATLAYIEIKLGISSEAGYDSPLNIFAIANNNHIKEIGRAKAEAFIAECKNKTISLSKGLPTASNTMSGKRRAEEPPEKEESRKKKPPPVVNILKKKPPPF